MSLVAQSASVDLSQFVESAIDFASHFWWLPVIIGLAWYLRWYQRAKEEGVSAPWASGFSLMVSDVFGTTRRAIATLVIMITGILGFMAFTLNIIPAVISGVSTGDPIVISFLAGIIGAASAAFDVELATPRNVGYLIGGVFVIMVILDLAVDELQEQVDDGDE